MAIRVRRLSNRLSISVRVLTLCLDHFKVLLSLALREGIFVVELISIGVFLTLGGLIVANQIRVVPDGVLILVFGECFHRLGHHRGLGLQVVGVCCQLGEVGAVGFHLDIGVNRAARLLRGLLGQGAERFFLCGIPLCG